MRSPIARTGLVRRPSQTASAWIPGTPKATSAPAASRHSATSFPPVRTLTVCATAAILSRRMSRDPRHDVLFEPLQIGPKTLRNRFYAVPHCTGYGTEKPGSQAWFRAMKAEGGWAAVCTEYAPVSWDSDEAPYVSARLWDDDDLANLAVMCERVHEHGALAGIELTHTGGACHQPPVAAPLGGARPSSRATTSRTSCPRRWSSPTSSASARTGCAQPSARARRGSTSSTSTAGTATCRSSSSRRSTTGAPTSTAAPSRTARASGSRRSRP